MSLKRLGRLKTKKNAQDTRVKHVKVGDTVVMLAGKDKGKTGVVSQVNHNDATIVVDGLNIVKKAVKPNPMTGQQGGLLDIERRFPASKVMLYSIQAEKPTRIKHQVMDDGRKVRVCRHSGAQLD
jgi:large subunit ribosomal protein L24